MKLAMIAASLILIGSAQAQSLKEKFELSERCGKQAAERFEKNSTNNVFPVYYENHYNLRLNKCFYFETIERRRSTWMNLWDLHQNKLVASYIKSDAFVSCVVQDKRCASEDEWRALIKPFMED